ncbi:MAG TPA: S9 family peptidase [Gemmatimonadales bacterium]|nr:S9 family peptidase [Gemmatimonadales bacterium]
MRRLVALVILWAVSSGAVLPAQLPADLTVQLHDIFASGKYYGDYFGPSRWIEGGSAYTTVEPSSATAAGVDIVRYETSTGARRVLVSAAQLIPAGARVPLEVEDYSWSPDGSKLLVFTNSRKVWRQNTRGDFWVLDLSNSSLQQLGGKDADPSTLMYAKFSPQGDRVAYVRKGDVYVERLRDHQIVRLTTGADSLHVSGMTDWVYEEEFDLRDGFRWSPDGERIAFWHFDMSGVRTFLMIDNTDSLYPYTIPIQYPKAGTPNSAVSIGVVKTDGGSTTWLKIDGDARDNYLPRLQWTGPNELMVQQMNRLQNIDHVLLANASSGSVHGLFAERDSAWLDAPEGARPWIDGNHFLWESERDGWRHVYAIARNNGSARLLTPGTFDVTAIAAVDTVGGWLYYLASPDNATESDLFRVKLAGASAPERLSPWEARGTHSYNVSPDAHWAIHTFSTFDTPAVTDLVSLPDHQVVRTLVANDAARHAVATLVTRPTEFFKVPLSDGATLDGWMIRPRDFDSTRTYPVLMYVYGEPADQTVVDRFSYEALWFHALADQGYIVASVDNRGTPAAKGRAWRKVVYGQIGVLSSAEQADAVRVLTRTRPYLDSTRVGIWGWSGGGSSTLQALFRYPDVYQMGMSVAPVPDERLYDTIYQERYMGLPTTNGAAYDSASAITHAAGLEGHLLLVHGSGDDNVHFQGSQRLLNRLIALGKQVDFMEYPNRSHCICEGAGTTLHVYTLLSRYLLEHLPAGGRRQ